MASSTSWSDPTCCPFCGDPIATPGAGFIDHAEDRPACASAFETWRSNAGDDIVGGWAG